MCGSLFTFPAGRRAKWVVFAIWFVGDLHRRRPGQPARQVRRRRKQRGDLLPARRRRIDQRAEGDRVAAERRNRPGRDRLPPRLRPHRRRPPDDRRRRRKDDREALPRRRRRRRHRGRRRRAAGRAARRSDAAAKDLPPAAARRPPPSPASPPATRPSSARSARTDGKAAIVTAYIKGNGEGERIVDPVKFWREQISDAERRPGGEDHRRRRLLRRRDRSLRRHQRHPAAGRGQPGDLPPDRDLPLADVLPHPADRGDLRRDPLALDRLRRLPSSG